MNIKGNKPMRTIKEPHYSARTLASQTGLSLSTVYRRQREGYSALQIIREAAIMKEHKDAGSNWKKVAKKTGKAVPEPGGVYDKKLKELENEWTGQTVPSDDSIKERKRVVHWEPCDDYGEVRRLKVLGGWIIQAATEVLFVTDPKHKWEV